MLEQPRPEAFVQISRRSWDFWTWIFSSTCGYVQTERIQLTKINLVGCVIAMGWSTLDKPMRWQLAGATYIELKSCVVDRIWALAGSEELHVLQVHRVHLNDPTLKCLDLGCFHIPRGRVKIENPPCFFFSSHCWWGDFGNIFFFHAQEIRSRGARAILLRRYLFDVSNKAYQWYTMFFSYIFVYFSHCKELHESSFPWTLVGLV